MARIFIEPFASGFAGGVANPLAQDDSTRRSQTGLGVPVGTVARDVAGNKYMAVKAGASIVINAPVVPNAGLSDVRGSSAAQQFVLGVTDAAFASGDFGWVLTDGSVVCKVVGATAINSLLVTGGTAVTLQLATAADFSQRGCVQITAEAGGLATVFLR